MFLAGFNCGHRRPHIRTASSTWGQRKSPDRAKQPGLRNKAYDKVAWEILHLIH